MKKSTVYVFVATFLVLAGSVACARGNRFPINNNPFSQDTPESQTGAGDSNTDLGPMKKVTVSQAESRNAVCNDGTPAVYFIRRGTGDGSTRWVIHLQGGGYCYSPETCKKRGGEEAQLMTTKNLRKSRPGNGILAPSGSDNHHFANVNQVFIAYCSSDLWSGDRAASSETNGLHFRGAAIVRAVIEDLSNPSTADSPNLADATEILLSGSSAGGVGVLVHLDWLAGKFPNAKAYGVDDAGWFINIPPYNPALPRVDEASQAAYEFWNGTVDESCAAAKPNAEGTCYLGESVYPYISTPLFVQIAQFDGPQLINLGITLPLDNAEMEYAARFGQAVQDSLTSVTAAFSPADRTHGLLTTEKFKSVRIQNLTLQDVLANWLFQRNGPIKLIGQP